MSNFNRLFDLLDDWRHLPNYQLERRADVFFALYLPMVIESKFNLSVRQIIPEFPLRIGAISDIDINRSFKIDYVVFTNQPNHCYFLELKTDDCSRRTKQDWYLESAAKAGMKKIVDGIIQIYGATVSKDKYSVLLTKLIETGLIADNSGQFKNITPDNFDCQIVYLQPNCESIGNDISFSEMASIVERAGDPLSIRFAESLNKWATIKAGTTLIQ